MVPEPKPAASNEQSLRSQLRPNESETWGEWWATTCVLINSLRFRYIINLTATAVRCAASQVICGDNLSTSGKKKREMSVLFLLCLLHFHIPGSSKLTGGIN